MDFHHASSVLWPPGSGHANAVKHAAAVELHKVPSNTLDLGKVANAVSLLLRAPVNSLLAPMSLSAVLQEDPAFIVVYSKNHKGACCLVHVRLDVQYVLATAGIQMSMLPSIGGPHAPMLLGPQCGPALGYAAPADMQPAPAGFAAPAAAGGMWGGPEGPPLSWQEDRMPAAGLNASAAPFIPGAAEPNPTQQFASAGAVQQLQQYPRLFEMQMQQDEDGSYVPLLAPHNSSSDDTDNAPVNRGGRRKVKAKRSGDGSNRNNSSNSADDINSLLSLLPMNAALKRHLQPYVSPAAEPYLVDLAADLGRNITLRLSDKSCVELPVGLDLDAALEQLAAACSGGAEAQGSAAPTLRVTRGRRKSSTAQPAPAAAAAAGGGSTINVRQASFFSDTNRLGVPGSLHRISAMRDRSGAVYGLTYRVGRHVPGVADLLADVLSSMRAASRSTASSSSSSSSRTCHSLVPSIASQPSKSLLLLGRPGVGKTTLLRDVARLMSLSPQQGGLGMSVVIVDTSNEIAGDSEMPHPCIGNARRMMVPRRDRQAAVMVEAVMNHTPEVVIVDEIATKEEAAACRTIAQRGVMLVSTAHGHSLGDLLRNPDLQGVVGGVKAVTLGDKLAQGANNGHKTRLERAGGVTFGSLVEILDTNKWRLHPDVAQSVDALLSQSYSTGSSLSDLDMPQHAPAGVDTQLRSRSDAGGKLLVEFESGRAPHTAVWAEGVALPPPPPPPPLPAAGGGGRQQTAGSPAVGKKRGRQQAGGGSPAGNNQQQQRASKRSKQQPDQGKAAIKERRRAKRQRQAQRRQQTEANKGKATTLVWRRKQQN